MSRTKKGGGCMRKFFDKDLLTLGDGAMKLSLFALTLPLFFESVSGHLIGVVQTMMSSRYHGGVFVIPVSVAGSVYNLLNILLSIISTGLSIVLSIELGKKNEQNCKNLVGNALFLGIAIAVVLSIVGCLFAKPLLTVMGMDKPEYAPYMSYATTYLRVRIFGMIIQICSSVMTTSLRCYGHTKEGFICTLISNACNAGMTALVVFVFKVPEANGALALAIVSLLAVAIHLLASVLMFKKKNIPAGYRWDKKCVKEVLKIGTPASVSNISYNISQTVAAIICLSLTPVAYLAKNYISQIVFFVYIFGYALGQANAIMIGRLCGMKELDKADKMQRQNWRIVILCNVVASLLFASVGKYLVVWLFAAEESVASYAAIILLIDVFVEIGRGMNHIGQNGLNATGDVQFTTIASMSSCWICSIGLSYLFVIVFGWDLYGMWAAFAVDEISRGLLYYFRWRKQGWRKRVLKD